jgi:hypothetical protein
MNDARTPDAFRLTPHGASAHVAQSVEHVLGKDEVTSSILVVGSIETGLGTRDSGLERQEE